MKTIEDIYRHHISKTVPEEGREYTSLRKPCLRDVPITEVRPHLIMEFDSKFSPCYPFGDPAQGIDGAVICVKAIDEQFMSC